jgi:hypothetical protein
MAHARPTRTSAQPSGASSEPPLPGAPPGDLDREQAAVDELRRALRSIRFGSVLIKIHEGRVVGIETSTKLRLGDPQA